MTADDREGVPPMRLRALGREPVVWLFILIALVYFFEPLTTGTFYFRDLYRLFYPKRLFFTDAIRSGEVPLWDPTSHGGVPFLATPSAFALHPSNLLYAFLPTIFAFNFILVVHVLAAAVAAYVLVRVLELPRTAAFVAGMAFGFCGYTLSATNLIPLTLALPWIPATIALAIRALKTNRSLFPAAVAAAMPLYACAVDVAAMLYGTLLLWVLLERGFPMRKRLATIGVVIAGGIGLSLAMTLPATSVVEQSMRARGRSYESFTNWSVRPERLPELAIPRFLGDTDSLREDRRWGRNLEGLGYPYMISIYLGAPLLVLAIAGARRRPLLAVLAVAGLLLSLGRYLPGFRLIYEIPLVSVLRYPVKAQMLALLPLAVLAAFGVQVLSASAAARRRAMVAAIAIGIAAGAVAAGLQGSAAFAARLAEVFSFTVLGPAERSMLALSFVHAAAVSVAFAIAVASRRTVAIAAVVAIDLLAGARNAVDFAPREIYEPPPFALEARRVTGEGRFHAGARPYVVRAPDDDLMWLARWQIQSLAGYHASMFGMPAIYHEDYDGLAPVRIGRLGARIDQIPWPLRRLLFDRANVRAYVTPAVLTDIPQVAQLETPGAPLRLYANPTAVPARFVSSAVRAAGERDAARRLLGERDLSRVVLEEPPANLGNCGAAPVQRTGTTSRTRTYAVLAPCDGYVVIGESHYDGWSATVDGRPAKLVRADFAFTAVAVPRGRHQVALQYFPPRLYAGIAGALATAVALVLFDRRRRREMATS